MPTAVDVAIPCRANVIATAKLIGAALKGKRQAGIGHITAVSSIPGINFVVNDETKYVPLAISPLIMVVMSIMLLIRPTRKGW